LCYYSPVNLLSVALQRQDYELAAYVLVYGVVKARLKVSGDRREGHPASSRSTRSTNAGKAAKPTTAGKSHTAKAVSGHGDLEIGMTAKGKGERKSSPPGFYRLALDEAERIGLEEAFKVEGVDDEIALLRVKLRAILQSQPDRTDLHFEAANVIARLVKTRYQISREEKKSIKEGIQKVITEIGLPIGVGVGIKLAGK